jgi:hypothetical protein
MSGRQLARKVQKGSITLGADRKVDTALSTSFPLVSLAAQCAYKGNFVAHMADID